MAATQNFRSAFNGFNREDVVHYIEYLNAKHTAEVNQLTSEVEYLRSKQNSGSQFSPDTMLITAIQQERDDYKKQLDEHLVVLEELEKRCAVLETERDAALASDGDSLKVQELESRCQSLELQLQAAIAAQAQAETARDAARSGAAQCRVEQELEAYRRAERTERVARERAEQVYRQANGALADATTRVDEAAAQIGEMTDRVSAQLAQLQAAVTGSKQALRDAAATLYTIRPGSAEE